MPDRKMAENRQFILSQDEIIARRRWTTDQGKSVSGEGFDGYSYGDHSPPLREMHISEGENRKPAAAVPMSSSEPGREGNRIVWGN